MDIEERLNEETKACPQCAEMIKLKARKCRFCGSELDPSEVELEVEARKAVLSNQLAKEREREGKVQCPQCGDWDVRWAQTEDGGQGHWCDNCKKSLKAMGFDVPRKSSAAPQLSQEAKVVIEQKSSGVWTFVGVLLAILLILIILGSIGI
jgi:predicted RNA-binding Zn-ribbon protein involved in translation (DUF1610 family)